MPLPAALGPVAWRFAQFGAVAALTWAASRRRGMQPVHAGREGALDGVGEGVRVETRHGPGETRLDGTAAFRRAVRLGRNGPGVSVEAAGFGRVRLRRLDPR